MVKEILRDLVAINTIADKDNDKMMDYLENFFGKLGFEVKRIKSERTQKEVMVAQYGENPVIGFLGHTDTVDITEGWETDPHVLIEKDGQLYGLGACDMKGGIAAFMDAIAKVDLSKVDESKGIAVYLTYDEEIMFDGIKDLVAAGTKFPPHVVVAEPTELIPMVGSKGLLEYIFTFTGVTTHSSTPIDGKSSNKNAVRFLNKMMDFEEELRRISPSPFFGVPYPTMNIGIVNGGTSINKVPDKTTVYLDFRICDSEKEYPMIRGFVDKALEGLDGEYVIINDIPSFQNHSPLVARYEEKSGKQGQPFFGITEASFFEGDRVIIGPGPMTAHEANEHVSVESLLKTAQIYKEMIEELCQ
ncbi:MAG: M20/M25/M40 family metallo-hydrolase [Firmicutes bacterium]|nr:M20/M25/M40 family metallo-hydrolase [Bacillota bacterium]